MQFPMVGSWMIDVQAVKPFTIHGDLYYKIQAVLSDDPDGPGFSLRVPQHAVSAEPEAGQRVEVSFLMGQVTGVKSH